MSSVSWPSNALGSRPAGPGAVQAEPAFQISEAAASAAGEAVPDAFHWVEMGGRIVVVMCWTEEADFTVLQLSASAVDRLGLESMH